MRVPTTRILSLLLLFLWKLRDFLIESVARHGSGNTRRARERTLFPERVIIIITAERCYGGGRLACVVHDIVVKSQRYQRPRAISLTSSSFHLADTDRRRRRSATVGIGRHLPGRRRQRDKNIYTLIIRKYAIILYMYWVQCNNVVKEEE